MTEQLSNPIMTSSNLNYFLIDRVPEQVWTGL